MTPSSRSAPPLSIRQTCPSAVEAVSIHPNNRQRIDRRKSIGRRKSAILPAIVAEKICIYALPAKLSRPMNWTFGVSSLNQRLAHIIGIFTFAIFFPAAPQAFAQDALVASAQTVEPQSLIPPDESNQSVELNPPQPVATDTTPAAVNDENSRVDSGVPRRFHYELRFSARGVYDDNI